MTFEQKKEFVTLLVTLIGGQILLILGGLLHIWLSSNRGRETRQQNEKIIADVAQVKGKLEGVNTEEPRL